MKQLTIVQMNDTHAYLDLHPELFWERGKAVYRQAGGYARIASLLEQIRAENPGGVLLADGGDTFHGTLPAVQTKGEALVPILNALEPDAMTAHWEFAYTPRGFEALTKRLNYPMLAINVYRQEDKSPFFPPYTVVERAGLRIGIAGIASNLVDKVMPASYSEGLSFTDGREELPGVIQALREQENVDLVVLLSHLGYPQDMHLVKGTPGVDVVLSAHTHNRLEQPAHQGGALVIQSGSHGSFITRLDLFVEGGKVVDFKHQLIEVTSETRPDRDVESLVSSALRPFQEEANQVVGQTLVPLTRAYNLESTMDNFLLSALLDHTGARMAFSNGWRYGAPITPGTIYLNDLYNIVPVEPRVSTAELSGMDLTAMLEENLERTFSRNPMDQLGGYVKRAQGIRVFFKVENPPNHRIHKLFVGDEEVRPERMYPVAYITEQGVPSKYGENHQRHPEKMVDVMCSYLKKTGPVDVGVYETFMMI